jgi:hypothetical protein
MKQTALEWLEKELNYITENVYTPYIDLKIKQALEMEKEQIINAYDKGEFNQGCNGDAEQYYNKTFKQQENETDSI